LSNGRSIRVNKCKKYLVLKLSNVILEDKRIVTIFSVLPKHGKPIHFTVEEQFVV